MAALKMLQLNVVTIVGTFCVVIFFLFRVALITPKRIPNWIKTTTSASRKAELLGVVLIMSLKELFFGVAEPDECHSSRSGLVNA